MKKESVCERAVKTVTGLAKAEGISVAELLGRAGVSMSTFWRWKNNKSHPDKKTILLIETVSRVDQL